MKKSGQTPVIMWEIVQTCSPYKPNSERCYLCLNVYIYTYLNIYIRTQSKCTKRYINDIYIYMYIYNQYPISKYGLLCYADKNIPSKLICIWAIN